MPRFVIVVPNYNCGAFLGESIESSLKQKFDDFAVVVSDNASTDSSVEVTARYSDSKLRVHLHKVLLDKTANWNRAYNLAPDCEYLVNLHSDDRLEHHCLSAINAIVKERKPVLVYGANRVLSFDGAKYLKTHRFPLAHSGFGNPYKEILILGNPVTIVGTAIRRDVFERLGGWPDRFNFMQDLELWLKLADEGENVYTPNLFGDYRAHGPSVTHLGQIMDELEFWCDFVTLTDVPRLIEATEYSIFQWYDRACKIAATVPTSNVRFHKILGAAKEVVTTRKRPSFDGLNRTRWLRLKLALSLGS